MHGQLTRCLVAFLIIGLVGGPAGLPGAVALAAVSQAEAERLLVALADTRAELPRDTFDTFSVLDQTDFTVEGAFAWVRDSTRLVPYRGALRGATGVMQDREGNSLDRALLLQDLLDALGYDTRLARGALDGDAAAELLASVRERSWERTALQELGEPTTPAELAERFGLDEGLLETAADAVAERASAFAADLSERSARQAALLGAKVAELGQPAAATDAAHERALLEALADHWWVQYQDESGAWVDMDPSSPGGEPGSALAARAQETLSVFGAGELPAEHRHEVSMAVVLECVADGALRETTLVATEPFLPSQLLGQRVSVTVLASGLNEENAQDAAALSEALMSEQHWFPTINVGDVSYTDLEFSPACETAAFTPSSLGGAVKDVLGGAMDALMGLGPAADAVTALRLELRLQRPGAGELVLRRDLVDTLGAAKRAAGELAPSEDDDARLGWRLRALGETEVLITAGGISHAFAADLTAKALLAGRQGVMAVATGASEPATAAPAAVAPSALLALALERQRAMPVTLYQAEPNVLLRHAWLEVGAGGLERHQAFDVMKADLASYSSADAARAERLAQGVAETNAEALLALQLCRDDATAEYCLPYGNAADTMEADPDPDSWLVLSAAEEVEAALPSWPADARAALADDLRAGNAAVVPATPPTGGPTSWWRVDPTTGAVLGVSETGRGDAAFEYGMLVNLIGFSFCMAGAIDSGTSPAAVTLCTFGLVTGTGGLMGSLTVGTTHFVGALLVASALLYGIGGLGVISP